MIESQRRNIGGMEFTVTPLPGKKGFETFPRVMKLLSPALEQIGAAIGENTVNLGVMAKAVASLAQTSPQEFTSLFNLLLENAVVSVDGNQQRVMQAFDIVFAGKTLTAYKALAFAVEVNYRDFFEEVMALFQKSGAQAAIASRFPSTSATPGPVGASSAPAGQP